MGRHQEGQKLTFSQAFDYRYRNEGKKKKKLAASGGTPAAIPQRPTKTGGGSTTPKPTVTVPSRPRRQQPTSNTVKQVVVSIDESGDETVVKLDKIEKDMEDLMTKLRMWQIGLR